VIEEKSPEQHSPLDRLRHSTAHVMASAVKRLFPDATVTIGPAIDTGFYYDFDVERPFTEEDLPRIEAEMARVVAADEPFVREEVSREDALRLFEGMGETYKVEIIRGIAQGQTISLYRNGDFVDLCRGPHIERTGQIAAFKLLSVAGAYWRGDERNPMLSRIYGTAFMSQEDLDAYLTQIEEAKRRDHRKLGRELDLFSIDELVGPGLVLWHPKGAMVRYQIEELLRRQLLASGYQLVNTPHVAREDLWKTSGHLEFYADLMYGPMEVEGKRYRAKPMNCPFHMAIYRSALRSYRDLPMRLAELGTVYRFERSGVLHGLLRVRGFTQDDAHLFCHPDDLSAEIDDVLRFGLGVLRTFGFEKFRLFLATRPEKYVGDLASWDHAEAALRQALERSGMAWELDAGGGAFYGPKIDVKIEDAIGREWQLSTFQVDFNLPERFDLQFVDKDGQRRRPSVIHRALLGSMERFFAILVEHYAGAFPLWLAPVQARVLTVTDRAQAFAREVQKQLQGAGLRAEADLTSDKLGAKVRRAQLDKIPYMLVIGDRESEAGTVAPRARDGKTEPAVPLAAIVARLTRDATPNQGG
jgi:threonyl-tRNA synthetase